MNARQLLDCASPLALWVPRQRLRLCAASVAVQSESGRGLPQSKTLPRLPGRVGEREFEKPARHTGKTQPVAAGSDDRRQA